MNVHLTYHSGQSYSERLTKFKTKVLRKPWDRVHVSFKDEEFAHGYAAFSLPIAKAQQLAHAILTATAGDVAPIEFPVDDSVRAKDVAA